MQCTETVCSVCSVIRDSLHVTFAQLGFRIRCQPTLQCTERGRAQYNISERLTRHRLQRPSPRLAQSTLLLDLSVATETTGGCGWKRAGPTSMGIGGLLPLLKEVQKACHVKEWAGKRVAVDSYVSRSHLPQAVLAVPSLIMLPLRT